MSSIFSALTSIMSIYLSYLQSEIFSEKVLNHKYVIKRSIKYSLTYCWSATSCRWYPFILKLNSHQASASTLAANATFIGIHYNAWKLGWGGGSIPKHHNASQWCRCRCRSVWVDPQDNITSVLIYHIPGYLPVRVNVRLVSHQNGIISIESSESKRKLMLVC